MLDAVVLLDLPHQIDAGDGAEARIAAFGGAVDFVTTPTRRCGPAAMARNVPTVARNASLSAGAGRLTRASDPHAKHRAEATPRPAQR